MSEEIRKSPYSFICNYAESIYPKIGQKTFEVLSLLPPSLILPDIDYESKTIRSNINAIFLGPSGSGKSSIAKLFSKFVVNALELESVTPAGLEGAITNSGGVFTLIVGDFARMSREPILMKVLEGILGEDKSIKRKTARKDIDMDVNGIALLCGVNTDLSRYILSGMVWRLVPVLIGHTVEEHSEIGEHIIKMAGVKKQNNTEEIISEYYNELLRIQAGDNRIVGYNIPDNFKAGLYKQWRALTEPYVKELGLNFFRELWDGLRFMIAHAFLNYYNRKTENGILFLENEDYEVGLKLMKQSVKFKFRLIRSESFAKGLKDAKDFKRIMMSDKVPEQIKDMIRSLVEVKGENISLRR